MSQAILKELRKDLLALTKRQELFEDKLLSGSAPKEDTEYLKTLALSYAEETRKVRMKILDLLPEAGEGEESAELQAN
jgi:hypothetical protein